MRWLRYAGLTLIALTLAVFIATAFNVTWVSSNHSTRIELRNGAIKARLCQAGDFIAADAGWKTHGAWRFWPLEWKPKYQENARVYVPARKMSAEERNRLGAILSKPAIGTHIIVPLWIPLALGMVMASWGAWPAYVRSRRRARGQCEACGYDLRGSSSATCPECGRALDSTHPSKRDSTCMQKSDGH